MNKKRLIFTVSLIVMMTISSLQAQLLQKERQLPVNNRETSLQQRENSRQLKNQRAKMEQQKQNVAPQWRTEMKNRQQSEQISPNPQNKQTLENQQDKQTSPKQQASKKENTEKPPLVLDVSSLKTQSGKRRKENASFIYKPVTFTADTYTDYDSLTSNSQTISTIRNQGGEHYAVGYSVGLAQGDNVDITLCSYNTNGFDAYLYLLDANYDIIAYKDDGAGGLCERPYGSRLQKLISTTGTYYIIATSYSSKETGNFTLDITKTTAPSKTYYVDALTGNNANDGQTPSTPLASLNAAMDSLNAVPSVGTIYVMSDILLTEKLDIHYDATLLANGSNTYTIKRDINNLINYMFEVNGDLHLGNATMTGQLIIDGGYDAVNAPTVYSGNRHIYNNKGTLAIYAGITLQNNVIKPSSYYGGSIYNEGVITMYGGQITQNGASYGGAIFNDNGTITLNGGSIDNNMGYDYGSGIYSYGGRLTLNGGLISDVIFLEYATLELGSSYTNTTSKQIDVHPYRRGKQVLTGNLVPDVVASFQTLNPNWGIDTEGKLNFIGTPDEVYVSNTGNNANTGTLSDPFASLNHAVNVLNNGTGVGTIYVMSDMLDSNTAYIYSEITLLPYGNNTYTIKKDLSYFTSTMFEVYGVFSLGNATMTGQLIIDGGYDAVNASTVYSENRHIYNGGTLDIYTGITLQNNVIDPSWGYYGGSIYNYGDITMYGGQITQNAATYGGGVYNTSGTLTLNGGSINNNTAYNNGGGVYNRNNSTIALYNNGSIDNNVALNDGGGGIWNRNNSTVTLNGGSINSNRAAYGGGVYNYNNSTITLNNGNIDNNTALNDGGGGIWNTDNSTVTLNGGSIDSNRANYGGGVYNTDNSIFFMQEGSLSYNNTGAGNVGGIINDGGYFTMSGGTITNNNNESDSIAIWHETKTMLFEGGSIAINNRIYLYDGVITIGNSYTNTTTKQIELNSYSRGKQVLTGNLATAVVASFQMQNPNWGVDAEGKLEYIGAPVNFYVSNTGNDADDGSLSNPFKTLEHAVTMANMEEVGVIYVMSDLLLSSHLEINSDISILPHENNTYTILRDTLTCKNQMINVYDLLTLGTADMSGSLIFDGGYDTTNNPTPFIARQSILNIYNGEVKMYNGITLQNNNTTGNWWGAGVFLDGGSLTMYGGSIENNIAQYGGGIYSYYGTITLNGGSIDNNTAYRNGGGIYNKYYSTVTIYSGSVSGNEATQSGGGIYNEDNSKLTIDGGSIDNNIADYGGGIANESNGTTTVNSGSISGNESTGYGGGIGNENNSTVIVNGGNIDNNTASNGGGIDNYNNSTVIVNGGSITGNEAKSGGGVNNEDNSTVTLDGGSITGNEAKYGGGITNYSTLTIDGGSIENNIAVIGSGILHYNGNISLQGIISFTDNDIATVNDGGNVSFIQMKDAIATSDPITLTPTYYDNGLNTFLLDYTPCRKMVEKGSDYTFKGQDLNVFSLQNVTDTVLAFATDNNSINIFAAPDAANDTNIFSCGSYTHNGITYTGSGIGYEYTSGVNCDSLTRRFIISVFPFMEDSITTIHGHTTVTTQGNQIYTVNNISGASYVWKCSNSKWTILGSEASIYLNIQEGGSGTLTVQVIGECDTATRSISINASFTGIEDHNVKENIILYPNPATTQITITGYNADMKEITLYSVEGKLIKTIAITDETTTIDIQNQTAGIYFLYLQDKDGRKSVKKFVKK